MSRAAPQFIDGLPHWARVAFAARCARLMLPVFNRAWPDSGDGIEKLAEAVERVERSAGSARVLEGLARAETDAVLTAGRALCRSRSLSELADGLPPPVADLIASVIAKSVQWAARAAAADESQSGYATLEAYTFARQAAEEAGADEVLDRIHDDLGGLLRVARKGGWTDGTPVPPRVFDLLAARPPGRRWWQFWR